MRPEVEVASYFETLARAERLQLLLHLARNAIDPVYLRAPAGAGKRRLVGELVRQLGEDVALVILDASEPVKPIASFLRQLNLPPEAADNWPQRLVDELGDRQVLAIIDRADALDDATREPLTPLAASGIRLLLVGEGGGIGDWRVQYVDLPPFDLAESAAFLRAKAGSASARVTDDVASAAYVETQGLPGPLLDALAELIDGSRDAAPPSAAEQASKVDLEEAPAVGATPQPVEPPPAEPARTEVRAPRPMDAEKVLKNKGTPVWVWAGGAALGVVLLAVLVFQNAINSLIDPDAGEAALELPKDATALAIPPAAESEPTAGSREDAPPVGLPELSRAEGPDGQAIDTAPDEAVASLMPPLERLEEDLQRDASGGADSAGPDPLNAVLQDALAAEAQPDEPVRREVVGLPESLDVTPVDALPAASEPSAETPSSSPLAVPPESSPPPPSESWSETPSPESDKVEVVASEGLKPDQPVTASAMPVEDAPTPEPDKAAVAASDEVKPDQPATASTTPVKAPTPKPAKPTVAEASDTAKPTKPSQPAAAPPKPSDSAPQPAPVEDRTRPRAITTAPDDRPKEEPAPVEERMAAGATAQTGVSETGEAWLNSRPPERYTLQLVGSRQRAAIEKFVTDNSISKPFAIFKRELNGSDWFSLVAGDYPDRDAAVAARSRLPKPLDGAGVWPRTFGSIRESR